MSIFFTSLPSAGASPAAYALVTIKSVIRPEINFAFLERLPIRSYVYGSEDLAPFRILDKSKTFIYAFNPSSRLL